MKKRFCFALILVLLLSLGKGFSAMAEGSNIKTSFDEKTGTLTVTGTGTVEELYPRDYTYDCEVTLWDKLFIASDEKVKHLIIGEGIIGIDNSFNDLYALEDISFPSTLKHISRSFWDCDRLTELAFPKNVTQFSRYSFSGCDGLKRLSFHEGVTVAEGFLWLGNLEEVRFSDQCHVFDGFSYCPKLKKVVLEGCVLFTNSIDADKEEDSLNIGRCFEDCPQDLTFYTDIFYDYDIKEKFPDHRVVEQVEEDPDIQTTFDEKNGTLTVSGTGEVRNLYPRNYCDHEVIKDYSEESGDNILWSVYNDNRSKRVSYSYGNTDESVVEVDTKVRRLVLEEGITGIYNSFNDLHGLEEIKFPESLTALDCCFIDCDKLKAVEFPDSLVNFERNIFTDSDGIRSLKFGSKAVRIAGRSDNFAFMDELYTVTIPKGSTVCDAFYGCNALETVQISEEATLEQSFHFCEKLRAVYLGKNVKLLWSEYYEKNFREAPKSLTVYLFQEDASIREALLGVTRNIEISPTVPKLFFEEPSEEPPKPTATLPADPPQDQSSDRSSKKGLNPWHWILIGGGALILLSGATILIWFLYKKRRK